MIYRLAKWLIWFPLALLSGLLFLLFFSCLFGAGSTAAKKRARQEALVETGKFVSLYLESHQSFPQDSELQEFVKKSGLGKLVQPSVQLRWPNDSNCAFPPWGGGKKNFAICSWDGDFHDYFDSATGRTTLDEQTHAIFWVNDSFLILIFAIGIGIPVVVTFLGARDEATSSGRKPEDAETSGA